MELTNKNLSSITQGKHKVIFWVPWGKPSFDQIAIAKKRKSKFKTWLLNVEENIDIARNYDVILYPTTIFFENGKELKRALEAQLTDTAELERIIQNQGFNIKESKTRLQKEGHRQEVTGLLVNKKVNVQKNLKWHGILQNMNNYKHLINCMVFHPPFK